MNLSCELPRLDCIKKPSKSDIDKLKEKNILPKEIIDRIFKDLEKEYNALKKHTKSKSKTQKSNSKTPKSKTPKSKTPKSKTPKSKSNSKTKSRTKTPSNTLNSMKGGELSEFKKNRITDMVILLLAGSSYWIVVPIIESWVLAMGILPTLCGQNMAEHVTSSLYATQGMSCQARAERYNTIVTSLTALITGSAWYQRNQFTKESLSRHYNSIHANVKRTLFGSKSKPKSPSASSRANK